MGLLARATMATPRLRLLAATLAASSSPVSPSDPTPPPGPATGAAAPGAGGGVASVRTFGAVGDGIADDAPAIQRAIDSASAAGGGIVHLPQGLYLCESSLQLRPTVSVLGAGWGVAVIASRAPGAALFAEQLIEHVRIEEFTVSHARWGSNATAGCHANGDGEGVGCAHLLEFRGSAARSRISLQLQGSANVTASGLVVRGLNPSTGRPSNGCYGLSIKLSTSASPVVNGVAVWLDGRDVDNARCNAHYLEPTSVLDGFTTGLKLNGNGNLISGVTFNGPTSNASVYMYGSGTFGNTAIGCYFDSGVTGKVVKLEGTGDIHMLTLYESVNEVDSSKVELVDGSHSMARYTIQSRGMLELGRGGADRGAALMRAGFNGSAPGALDKAGAAAAVVGVGGSSTLGLVGVPTTLGAGLIVAGENFSRGVNAVSDGGGASIQISDTPQAEFRVVKSSGEDRFEQLFGIDGLGRPHFTGATASAAGGGEAGPRQQPEPAAAPAGFIEVLVGGKVRKLAFYE